MPDLDERFRGADRVPAPEGWEEIEMRSRTGPRPPQRRVATTIVALAIAVASIALVAVAFRGVHGRRPAGELRANGVIVFADLGPQPSSIPFQNVDLFAFDPTTGERVNLTNTPTISEASPVWSRDGTKVVYRRTIATGEGADLKLTHDLVIANGDGSGPRVIQDCRESCGFWDIAWSPDGSHLAWTAEKRVAGGGYVEDLRTYDVASGSATSLCDSRTCGFPGQPAWSPDGTRIAFSNAGSNRFPGGFVAYGPIWVADVGSGQVNALTSRLDPCLPGSGGSCVFDSSPAWSPDGTRIAFVRTTHGGQPTATTDVVVMNADGSDQRVLSECASNDQCRQGPIAWSPDGARIAFVDRYDHPTLHLADPTGEDATTELPASVGDYPGPIVWSPDATQIAFLGGGRRSDLFLVDVATRRVLDVAKQLTSEGELAWLPAGAIDVSATPTPEPSSTTPAPSTSTPGGSIVFSSSNGSNQEDDGTEIWSIGTDGSGLTRLTDNQNIDGDPAISPDGTRVAFRSDRPGDRNTQIYVMNAEGSSQHVLTDRRTGAVQPTWSPDGTQIAFVSGAGYGEPGGIFVMNADGSGQHLVAEGNAFDPSWSPDGYRIVYALNTPDGETHLRVVDFTKGYVTIELPTLPGDQREPAWSPDGQTIALVWTSSDGNGIFTMRLDGSGLRQVADGSNPTWSPDGSWLAFTHTDDLDGPQIWVAAADGGAAHALTSMPGFLNDSLIYATTEDPSWGTAIG